MLVGKHETLGEYLASLRGNRSYERVAREAWELGFDITGHAVQDAETKERKPRQYTLQALAAVYRISYAKLLERAGHRVPKPVLDAERFMSVLKDVPAKRQEEFLRGVEHLGKSFAREAEEQGS